MKTLLLITILSSIYLNSYSQNEPQVIKEEYIVKGKKVYFNVAETKIVNGKRVSFTNFPHAMPNKWDSEKYDRWIESYKNYHLNMVAAGRINYFMSKEGLTVYDISEYSFIVSGYYADISYQSVIENEGYAYLYGTPIKWHER